MKKIKPKNKARKRIKNCQHHFVIGSSGKGPKSFTDPIWQEYVYVICEKCGEIIKKNIT